MPFVIKCEGGPMPGVRATNNLAGYGLSWPLPDELPGTEKWGGKYVKVSESQLPASAAEHPNLGLTALFVWKVNSAKDKS